MQTAAHQPVGFSDMEIARRVIAGDEDAFCLLMRRHNQTLYRTARSILRDDAEAEDAVQEAYLLAYRAIGSFRGNAKLSTWLVRIVVNEAIGRSRKRSRSAEVIRLESDEETDRAIGDANMDEATFERPERGVLRAVEEMTVEETAATLGIPESTVRTRFFRARGLLREALASEIGFALEDAFAFAGARCDRIVAGVLARLKELQARGA